MKLSKIRSKYRGIWYMGRKGKKAPIPLYLYNTTPLFSLHYNHRSIKLAVSLLLILFFSMLFQSCYIISSPPRVMLNKDFKGDDIAVLNFSKYGPNMPPEISSIAADKLTNALYMTGKFSVIDRANVNDAAVGMEISSPELLSTDQIQKLGLKLKADYLILGRIQNISKPDYFDQDKDKTLYISFRIINVLNANIMGMSTYKVTYKNNLIQCLNDAMKKIANKMASAE